MNKLCVFDLDGTLLDTIKDLYLSLNVALKENDMPSQTLENVRHFIGNGLDMFIKRASQAHPEKYESLKAAFKAHYDEHCNDHTQYFPGIKLLLQNLKMYGYKIAIVSNKNDEAVQELYNIYFKDYVDIACGIKEGMKIKPNPDTLFSVMKALDAKENDVIYIGDSLVDKELAQNANVKYLIVTWGYRTRKELSGVDEDLLISQAANLENKIKELNPIIMDKKEILKHCDHTLLAQGATLDEIYALIDDAIKYNTASVCIPPSYVKKAKEYANGKVKICTVIGFPNGYSTTRVKVFETKDAIKNGADEIDMVINIGFVKSKNYAALKREIKAIKKACGDKVLKVIIETCLLERTEKVKLCKIVTQAGADYIKTSTGFSKAGATKEDIILFKKFIGPNVKMKAAGGIRTLQDAQDYLKLGCDRLGTSAIVKIVKEEENA